MLKEYTGIRVGDKNASDDIFRGKKKTSLTLGDGGKRRETGTKKNAGYKTFL